MQGILWVDDDPHVCNTLAHFQSWFRDQGFKLIIATSVDDAHQHLRHTSTPPLWALITDWNLDQGYTGNHILQLAHDLSPTTKLAIVSGYPPTLIDTWQHVPVIPKPTTPIHVFKQLRAA